MKVEIEGLGFGYDDGRALFSIPSLSLAGGEAVGIVGPSGAGKTTFLRLLAGIQLPRKGHIGLDEIAVGSLDEAARRRFRNERIGLVFQDFRLLEYLSLRDNIRLPFLVGKGHDPTLGSRERIDQLADRLGLTGRIDARPGQLSQGEQQRVAIGRALVTQPRLILADEPTGNLDEVNKVRMRDLLLSYCREHAVTLIMVTHDPDLLGPFDRVLDFAEYQTPGAAE